MKLSNVALCISILAIVGPISTRVAVGYPVATNNNSPRISTAGLSALPVEENPDYVPHESDHEEEENGEDDSESDTDSGDESEVDEEEEEEEDEPKSMLNKALMKSNKIPSKALAFVRKNRTNITIACALFAFRREIWQLIVAITTVPNKDGSRSVRVRISPTAILKIMLFLDVMRKMQNQAGGLYGIEGEKTLASGGGGGRMGLFGVLTDLMKASNAAYMPPIVQHYTFEKINERYAKDENAFRKAMGMDAQESGKSAAAAILSQHLPFHSRHVESGEGGGPSQHNATSIIMEMNGLDAGVSSMDVIRDQITFILEQHAMLCKEQDASNSKNTTTNSSKVNHESKVNPSEEESTIQSNRTIIQITDPVHPPPQLEIIILLESPGGSATDYGLAAQQIARLRNVPGIQVTICVDKVAASGGYMIACMASPGSLIAAPFAVVGSIGVIGQTINIHKSLQNWGVQPLVFRGGKDKAPIGLVGEITKEGLAKVQDMVDKTHRAFKRHVAVARPNMAPIIDQVATGDVWIASDALEIGMVDVLMTSDEYIMRKIREGNRILKLVKCQRPRFGFGAPHPYFPGVEAMGTLQQVASAMVEMFTEFRLLLQSLNSMPIEERILT
mmetsp:Transcript_11071/g.20693  ORF Transcript_11071/g.20693 Transcript_11071/m.20693 type:complete len:617 (-) Transcript_11071:25-1875(-)